MARGAVRLVTRGAPFSQADEFSKKGRKLVNVIFCLFLAIVAMTGVLFIKMVSK